MIKIGTDIIEINRVENLVGSQRVFTSAEVEYAERYSKKAEYYAGLFCAKEACVKALGGVITDYEILHDDAGAPYAIWGDLRINISISHCRDYAIAMVVVEV